MKIFAVFVNFGLAALNVWMGVNALLQGRPVGVVGIAAAVFCFGCGVYTSLL